jgi:uncharacterized protein
MKTIVRWLLGDINKLGKQEVVAKELLIQLVLTMQTPVSHQTLAKKTSVGSHNTIQEYVSLLENCFVLRTLFAIDMDTAAYRFKNDKKFYFVDPIFYWIAHDLSGMNPPQNAEEGLAEMVAHEALSRNYNHFGYLRNRNGEVDFITPKTCAVEIKWSPIPTNLSSTYKNLVLPKKIIWSHNNFLKEFP